MSGFEVVGVVLGALPLIISALDGYRELKRKQNLFFKRDSHVGDLVKRLFHQQLLIESELKRLLRAAGINFTDFELSKSDSCRTLLCQQYVVDDVKDLIGTHYDGFLEIVKDCEEKLLRIAKAVGGFKQGSMVDSGKLADILKPNIAQDIQSYEVRKRLKFTMRKADVEREIQALDDCVRRLGQLTESATSHQLGPLSVTKRTTKMVRLAQKIRSKADSLHGAISRCWKGQCHTAHDAHLYLSTRLDELEKPPTKSILNNSAAVEFKLALEGFSDSEKQFRHVGVVKLEDSDSQATFVTSTIGPSVQFSLPSATMTSATPINARELADICQSVVQASQAKKILTIFLDQSHRLSYALCDLDPASSSIPTSGYVSLKKLQESFPLSFPVKQRLKLALLLSSSLLQLYNTAWMRETRPDWVFFHVEGNSSGKFDLAHPFVSSCFANGASTVQNLAPAQSDLTILNLGILIIELWHNQSIDLYCKATNHQLDESFDSRQNNARRWLRETKDSFLATVYEPAARCVDLRFDVIDIDLGDDQIQQSIVEGVIRPLLENCR